MFCRVFLNAYKYVRNTRTSAGSVCFYHGEVSVDQNLVENYIKNVETKYAELSRVKVPNPTILGELRRMKPFIQIVEQRNEVLRHLGSLSDLLSDVKTAEDAEMQKLAEEEKKVYESRVGEIESQLLRALVPEDPRDSSGEVLLEVTAGVGGQEAMLFARELFEMYQNFVEFQNWEYELAEFDATDLGGVRHASVLIQGSGAFRVLKYEAGVHRVQRIPATEKAGRVHTSTVSVVCLPQPKDFEIQLSDKDLRFETKRASGAGGQHVNTTDSAVRIVHIPSGIAVECQTDRSQIKNRGIALQRLKAKLYELKTNEQLAETEATRKSQVRSNFRNEKIRTYNFSQDRITDHRLQSSNMHNLKGFLQGGQQLMQLIEKIQDASLYDSVMQVLKSVDFNNKRNS